MNGGYAQFFVNQSVSDTRKSFRVVSRGKARAYSKRHLPRIRRSLRVAQSEPAHDTVGPILLLILAAPLLLLLGLLHGAIPGVVVLFAVMTVLTRRRKHTGKKQGV